LWVQGKVEITFQNEYSSTNKINYVLYTIAALLPIVVGIIIGLETFINENMKKGRWKLNLPKLIFIIIPSLFAASINFTRFINNETAFNILIKPFLVFFNSAGFIIIFEILLGYSIITLMYKTEANKAVMEDGIDEYHAEYDPTVDHNEFIEGSNEVITGSDESVADNETEEELNQ
jgi:predicted permease